MSNSLLAQILPLALIGVVIFFFSRGRNQARPGIALDDFFGGRSRLDVTPLSGGGLSPLVWLAIVVVALIAVAWLAIPGLMDSENRARQFGASQSAGTEASSSGADIPGAATAPAAYDLGQLDPQVRSAVEAARDAETRANDAATRARDAARQANEGGLVQPADGYGTATYDPSGDSYAGQWSASAYEGVGVYAFGSNSGNSLRFEGEWTAGVRTGVGIYYWSDNTRMAGAWRDGHESGPGVFYEADGSRYEGENENDQSNGYGVLWTPDGRVSKAGLWTNGALTTPIGAQGE